LGLCESIDFKICERPIGHHDQLYLFFLKGSDKIIFKAGQAVDVGNIDSGSIRNVSGIVDLFCSGGH